MNLVSRSLPPREFFVKAAVGKLLLPEHGFNVDEAKEIGIECISFESKRPIMKDYLNKCFDDAGFVERFYSSCGESVDYRATRAKGRTLWP